MSGSNEPGKYFAQMYVVLKDFEFSSMPDLKSDPSHNLKFICFYAN